MWAVSILLVSLAATQVPLLVAGKTVDHITLAHAKNCDISYEVFHSQSCTPITERKCQTVTFENQEVKYERKCVDVTSVHCPTTRPPLAKREAEPQFYNPWFVAPARRPIYLQQAAAAYPTYHPYRPLKSAAAAAAVKPAAVPAKHAAAAAAADDGCHKVTTEHCYDHPEVVKVPKEVEKCDEVIVMNCEPFEHKVPKTMCKPLQQQTGGSKSVAQAQQPQRHVAAHNAHLYNPFAYNFGWN